VFARDFGMLRQKILQAVIAHSPALTIGEYDLPIATRRFFQPRLQHSCRLFRQRCATFLSAFAEHVDMGAGSALNSLPG
jgi:hypothetical protein